MKPSQQSLSAIGEATVLRACTTSSAHGSTISMTSVSGGGEVPLTTADTIVTLGLFALTNAWDLDVIASACAALASLLPPYPTSSEVAKALRESPDAQRTIETVLKDGDSHAALQALSLLARVPPYTINHSTIMKCIERLSEDEKVCVR